MNSFKFEDWLSHCEKRKTMNTSITTFDITKCAIHWIIRYRQHKIGPIYDIEGYEKKIIQIAKECGFKVGKRKRLTYKLVRVKDSYRYSGYRNTKVISGYEHVNCLNISSMSIPFKPHLHNDEKRINYYHYYNPNLEHIHLLHQFINKSLGGNRLFWIMTERETRDEFNCYIDNKLLRIDDRQYMWGLRSLKKSRSDYMWAHTINEKYLNTLDRLVKNCPEFMVECEEKSLLKI